MVLIYIPKGKNQILMITHPQFFMYKGVSSSLLIIFSLKIYLWKRFKQHLKFKINVKENRIIAKNYRN